MLMSQDGNSRDRTGLTSGGGDQRTEDENEMMSSEEEDEKVDVGSVADLRPNLCFSGEQEGRQNCYLYV